MSLKKNVSYNILNNVLNVLLPIVTVPYVSRVLGVENRGVVDFAMGHSTLFLVFISLGIPAYGVREIGKHRNSIAQRSRITSELFWIMVISTLVFSLLYVSSVFFIPKLRTDWLFLMISGISLLFAPFNVDWFFTGRENLRIVVLRNIVFKTICLVGIFTLVQRRDDIVIYLLLNVLAIAGSQVWSFIYMLRTEVRLRVRGLNLRRHIKPVSIFFGSTMAISVYAYLDTEMLGLLSSYEQVGFYSSAIRVNRIVLTLVIAVSASVIPRISYLYKESDWGELNRVANKSFSFMSLLTPPITIGMIVISPVFVPWFFGPEFVGAIPSMMILSWIVIFISAGSFFGNQLLTSTGHERFFLYAVVCGACLNFTLNLLLIPSMGSIGASIGSVAAETCVGGVCAICAFKVLPKIKLNFRPLWHAVVASLPMPLWAYLFIHTIDSLFGCVVCVVATSALTFYVIERYLFKEPIVMEMRNLVFSRISAIFAGKSKK